MKWRDIAQLEEMGSALPGMPLQTPFLVRFVNYQQVRICRKVIYDVHSYPEYELIVPRSRAGYSCYLDEMLLNVPVGKFLLVQPFQKHQDVVAVGDTYDCYHFYLQDSRKNTEVERLLSADSSPVQQSAPLDDRLRECSRMLWNLSRAGHSVPADYPLMNALFQTIFELCVRKLPPELLPTNFGREAITPNLGIQIRHCFEEHLTEPLTLEMLCEATGLTKSTLNRACRQFFKQSPLNAFMDCRMRQAALLMLQHADWSIKQLAEHFGFANQFHFSRVFRHYQHEAPSVFRARRK